MQHVELKGKLILRTLRSKYQNYIATLGYPKRQDGTDGAWRWNKTKVEQERKRIDWIQGRNGWTPNYRIFAEENATRPPETIWPHGEVGSNRTSKSEVKKLFPDLIPFGTPKPERLLQRVIRLRRIPATSF